MTKPTVHVLVTGRSEAALPNCRLVFSSIRVGFPTFDIVVRDNDSMPEFVEELRALCTSVKARYYHQARGEHGAFIAEIVSKADGPVIFVDTDVIFWENCEAFTFPVGTLYAGRKIDAMTECGAKMAARIHPSLLWLPDPAALRDAVAAHPAQRLGYVRPFHGVTIQGPDSLLCYDTCAVLYSLLPTRAYAFTERELDCYDHLFCGTLVDTLELMGMSDGAQALIKGASECAVSNPAALRGLWRAQEGYQGGATAAAELVNWSYQSGLLRSAEGREFGLSLALLAQPGKTPLAHVGVLDVEAGAHRSEVVAVGERGAFVGTTVSLRVHSTSSGEATDHGICARLGGWTRHLSYPFGRLSATLSLDGTEHEVSGDVWYDNEWGRIARGAGWGWAALTLDDGGRAMVYDFGRGHTRGVVWAAPLQSTRVGAALARGDGDEWVVTVGTACYTLVPYAPRQTIFASVMTYTEALCHVYQGGARVGHAYLELLPDGWGRPQLPPQREMFNRWAGGNQDAAALMSMFGKASQLADDFVDGDVASEKRSVAMADLLDTVLFGIAGNPFYRVHSDSIAPFAKRALQWWHASNVWATDPKLETRMFSYVHREAMADVLWWISFVAAGDQQAQETVFGIHAYYHGRDGGVEPFAKWDREPKVGSSHYGQ